MISARHMTGPALVAGLALLLAPASLRAQAVAEPTQAAAPSLPPLNFSGVIFGSYNYQLPTTPSQLAGQTNNQFVLDRAYLTFRMPAGERTSIRVTTDVYQTSESTPNAYTIRAKYAYLQYEAPKTTSGAQVTGRLGILQNVAIDHIENFWPRYISQTAIERAGFFASADVGLAAQLTLPRKLGEVYATIVNGPGYSSREKDRFKDFAVRVSLTPLANGARHPLLQSFTLTGWGYKGATASNYVNGGVIPNVGAALDRSRAGLFVGLRDPRFVLGAEYDQRHDDRDTASTTLARTVIGTTGHVVSGFTVVRPLAFVNASGKSSLGLVARYDRVTPFASTEGSITPAPATSNGYHNVIGGMFWDLSQKAQLALDYQESLASSNGVSSAPPSQSKGYYAHFSVSF